MSILNYEWNPQISRVNLISPKDTRNLKRVPPGGVRALNGSLFGNRFVWSGTFSLHLKWKFQFEIFLTLFKLTLNKEPSNYQIVKFSHVIETKATGKAFNLPRGIFSERPNFGNWLPGDKNSRTQVCHAKQEFEFQNTSSYILICRMYVQVETSEPKIRLASRRGFHHGLVPLFGRVLR